MRIKCVKFTCKTFSFLLSKLTVIKTSALFQLSFLYFEKKNGKYESKYA